MTDAEIITMVHSLCKKAKFAYPGDGNDWSRYEFSKRHILDWNLTPVQYELAIKTIAKELGV